jgi:hypothetical protein
MSTKTDIGGDLLISPIASVLRVPIVELYALLWRVGVVEIRQSERTRHRGLQAVPPTMHGPSCPDPSAHERDRVVHWMSQPRTAPVYSRAIG